MIKVGGNNFGFVICGFLDGWFRVFGKGLSIQRVNSKYHMHLFSTRQRGLWWHALGYCIRVIE